MRKALRLGVMATLIAGGATAAPASLGPTPGEVYRVWLDGRLANLTRSTADDYAPVISPDGTRVAFVSDLGIKGHRVRIFVVGSNGRGRRSVSPPLSMEQDFSDSLAWSPSSKRLAFADDEQIDGYHEVFSLYLFTPGAGTSVIVRAPAVFAPSWSPDGRVIAFQGVRKVWGVTPAGKVLWRLKGEALTLDGIRWSANGLLAVERNGRLTVYDERGRQRARFLGRSFAWEPRGTRIAAVAGNRLEVRSPTGRLLFEKAVPGLTHRIGIAWADWRHVVVGGRRVVTVDLETGLMAPGGRRYFGNLSPDRTLRAETVASGSGFKLRVSRLDGGNARTLASRPNCPDLVENDVRWFPDGRSLAYDFSCQQDY